MPEQNLTTPETVSPNPAPPATPGDQHMIPKSRHDEVLEQNRKLSESLAAIETERKAETEKRLAEQNQWKELAEKRGAELADAQAKAAQVDEYEQALSDLFDKQMAESPEDKRGLVPAYGTTKQRLEWISINRALLVAPQPFSIGAGRQGGADNQPINLSPEEAEVARKFGMTPEEYAKNK